jgi:hypothetical protein
MSAFSDALNPPFAPANPLPIDLDFEYGSLLPARPRIHRDPHDLGYDLWEKHNTPHSIIVLNDITAVPLQQFMKQTQEGWPIGRTLVNDVIFIWLVDETGRIFVSLEELVIDALPVHVPKFQTLNALTSRDKLGHPSLVSCDKARIAGEIRFLPETSTRQSAWAINNASWRYGLYAGRTKAHLENAAAQFRKHNVILEVDFLTPR